MSARARGGTLLSELMGKDGAAHASRGGLRLEHLPALLGEAMPELPRDAVGRHRLVTALKNRFGDGWRSLPSVSGLLTQFDGEVDHEKKIAQIRAIKPKGK